MLHASTAATRGLLLSAVLVTAAVPAPADDPFEGREGCLVLQQGGTSRPAARIGTLCAERFSPCSTFKIASSLIGLEAAVVEDAGTVFRWDGVVRGREEWNRDHSLASAMRVSAVWYYQELARRVGPERMQRLLSSIPYGNGDTSGGIDRFWLGGSLRISPDEQVAFLERLRHSTLPFSGRSQRIVGEILLQESPAGVVYRGKTGSCGFDDAPDHGWWVGWVEKANRATVFAALVRGEEAFGPVARRLAEAELRRRGLLDP